MLLYANLSLHAQSPTPRQLESLAAAQRWEDIVHILAPLPTRTADQTYAYGDALAHLGRLPEATLALESGRRLEPRGPRFPIELAGIDFKQKRYPQAARLLRAALKLDPNDSYANDFLATVYFLEDNLPAAIQCWNRLGQPTVAKPGMAKPRIDAVTLSPTPRVSPALLDRAFAFSPAATLTLPQFINSQMRVSALGIFPQAQFDLQAKPGGSFDLDFRSRERNGFGDSRLEALFLFLHELPFQAVTLDYFNARRQAINFTSLARWDENKRRVLADLSAPFEHRARFRVDLGLDLRNENWALRNGFTGPAPVLASFNLRRESGSFSVASFTSDRFRWRLGAEVASRDERSVVAGPPSAPVLTPQLLSAGTALKQIAQFDSTLLRLPQHRFTLAANASSQAARLWSQPRLSFEKLQGALAAEWLPQAQGDDYALEDHLRAGRTFGSVPFDELFMLGLERDNDLPLRAHIGTRDGRKGSAPLGRDYLVNTWEADKNLYSNGLLAIKLGPFFDTGAISDANPALGSHKWLYDTGAQLKLRVFSTTVAFSYGKDLRSGNNAFYVNLLP
ncbi:MAG TPA: hypothetical protein VE291_06455 [Terracidiphilus sp.]|nr:hypothetical protein [Terracidiphilus sp.]